MTKNQRKERLIRGIAEIISNNTAGTYTGGVDGIREASEEILEWMEEGEILKMLRQKEAEGEY